MTLPTIAFISDYGNKDGKVGSLKGLICQLVQDAESLTPRRPAPTMIDISHEISPQNINEAAWILQSSYNNFPKDTVFVCVVDPKTAEDSPVPILLYWPEREYYFLAPNNGVLTPILKVAGDDAKVYAVENEQYYHQPEGQLSESFRGRDVYAALAGHLCKAIQIGEPVVFLKSLGSRLEQVVQKPWEPPVRDERSICGQIVYIDSFGNLVTNIPSAWLPDRQHVEIQLLEKRWQSQRLNAAVETHGPDKIYVVPSSAGTLELAQFNKRAAQFLDAEIGEKVIITQTT